MRLLFPSSPMSRSKPDPNFEAELGDGQVSGLPPHVPPREFYAALRTALGA